MAHCFSKVLGPSSRSARTAAAYGGTVAHHSKPWHVLPSSREVDDERGVVAQPGPPPVVSVSARHRTQAVHEDVVESPPATVLWERPARLSPAVTVQCAEGVDPPQLP